jgi:hypothetical protein
MKYTYISKLHKEGMVDNMQKTGIPSTIKRINESLIGNIFMNREPHSCAEIVALTGISITTVRALVNEMVEREKLKSLGLGESSGGRRAEKFIINDDYSWGISLCVTEDKIYVSRVNIHAEIRESEVLPFKINEQDMGTILIDILNKRISKDIQSIGIGVPGVVTEEGFLKNGVEKLSENIDILTTLKKQFALPIILENDLRACAMGFAQMSKSASTMAFINFSSSCGSISAGFVEGNKIIRGMGNYAGELGVMPFDEKSDFCEILFNSEGDKRSEIIAKLASLICCTINPQQIMLCSDENFKINSIMIKKMLKAYLPDKMFPRISTSSDFSQYYLAGMALLTAEVLF